MLLFASLFFAVIVHVKGQCLLYEQPKINDICQADIDCKGSTNNFDNIVDAWDCIKHESDQNYDYNNYHEIKYDDVFSLNVKIFETYFNPLIELLARKNNVIKLTIKTGNLILIPEIISNFNQLTQLHITYNKIESLDLSTFRHLWSIQMLNLSHNCISAIAVSLEDTSQVSSAISTIDLSYNELEIIPDNCFAMFLRLKYLDLSYNRLVKFDILTFEGMAQLETLYLSHNKITEIGQNFARFVKLKNLTLDNNQITFINDLNFKMLTSLEKLNLSSNLIKNIEEHTFVTLKNLKELDLSHNNIIVIKKNMFNNNKNMTKLFLSNNDIETIESGAFKANNISHFDIKNNYISGLIESDTFQGILVVKLDLSGENLTQLGDKAFSALSSDLKYLNLSANIIQNVSKTAFNSLKNLSILDLSFNNLIDIDFDTTDFTQLTEYYLQYNKIKKITAGMFRNLSSLIKLDLSQNMIVDIELNSFAELKTLERLYVHNNNFVNYLSANAFHGLSEVIFLDLSYTRSISYQNNSFAGMFSLTFLNSSHSQLEYIQFEAYNSTGTMKIIDLSYNMLENFQINTKHIAQLSELYLNDNRIKNITSETFKYLQLLEKVTLAHNNILYIDSNSFQTLPRLRYLELNFNFNLKIKGDIINNLFLSQVSLKNVKTQFNFENTLNSSITTLILSNCDINNVNLLFIYNIRNLNKLDFSSNKIEALDKSSFQSMPSLNWLDLSLNLISTIQPGTFMYTNMINFLNLHENSLQYLPFGVLDGLQNLRTLNLSSNAIHSFGAYILHSIPHLTQLSLENNNLATLDFEELSNTSITVLSIGGNTIPCTVLVNLKKHKPDNLSIISERLDFTTENVDGISCRTVISPNIINKHNNINITNEVIGIKETVEKLYNYLSLSHNETFSKIISDLAIIPDHLDNVSQILNNSQILFNQHLRHLFNENKELFSQLVNTSDNIANDIKLLISLLETSNNLTKLSDLHKEVIHKPLIDKTNSIQINQSSTDFSFDTGHGEKREVNLDYSKFVDVKVLLYFIAICLVIIIVLYAVTVFYKYSHGNSIFGKRVSDLCSSGHSKRNIIEMD